MKNNEIMISVRFENIQEPSFLVIKDITLRSFIESLYYGLAKKKEFSGCYELFVKYIKVRKELVVLYNVSRSKFHFRTLLLLSTLMTTKIDR